MQKSVSSCTLELWRMGVEKDAAVAVAGRKTYWRSASWSAATEVVAGAGEAASSGAAAQGRCPVPLTPRSQNSKARSSLPPLQPLSIARRSYDEWPKAGSDDLGVWPQPPTPSGRSGKPGEGLKLDLSSIRGGAEKEHMSLFNKECSKVADHIYLGGDSVARNREILRQNGITHVLNCVGFICPEYFKADLVYKTLWLQDSPTEDITSILYDVFDYFEDVREQGGRVFVHCCQGVSRSTSLVIAYLMWREGQSFDGAFQLVKAARGIANPNMGFACQLLQCQKRVHAFPLSPNSALRMYRMAPHSSYDPLHLVPKMLNEPSPMALDSRGAFLVRVPYSIFVWIGKECEPAMEKDAKAAAFQVVRYEKVRGSIVTVVDGLEPADFWQAFSSAPVSSESHAKLAKENVDSAIKIGAGKRIVESYSADFELFYKAITGGVLLPFSSSVVGQETHLPARESNWSILRRKFISGTISTLCSDPVVVKDADVRVNRSVEFSASPSFSSPSSLSSYSSRSSKSSSESPSCSLSTTSSPLLTPSPVSSNFHDSLFPPPRARIRLTSSPELVQPSCEDFLLPSKGSMPSITERRASFSPLKLPELTNNASLLSRSSASSSCVYVESAMQSSERSTDIQNPDFKDAVNCDVSCLNNGAERSSTCSLDDGVLHIESSGRIDISSVVSCSFKPLIYRWPSMEALTTLYREDLDSSALLLLLTTSTARGGGLDRKLFLWVGRCFGKNICEDREVDGTNEMKWSRVGSDFLSFMGLANDTPFKVVEGEDPEEIFRLFSSCC